MVAGVHDLGVHSPGSGISERRGTQLRRKSRLAELSQHLGLQIGILGRGADLHVFQSS